MDSKFTTRNSSDPVGGHIQPPLESSESFDFYLFDQDSPVTKASLLILLQSFQSKSETVDKLRDAFTRHYRFYLSKQRLEEAETVLYEFARMRNTEGALKEVIPLIYHFYRVRPGLKGKEIAYELQTMLSCASDEQYWTLYRQCATICYMSRVPEAAHSLSRTPVTEMTDSDFSSWVSVYQWISIKFSGSERYRFNRAYSLWTIAEGLYQRNPGSHESLLAMVEFARYCHPGFYWCVYRWRDELLNRGHLVLAVSRIRAASDPIVARAISALFHPEFEWNKAGATVNALQWATHLHNSPHSAGSSHCYFNLLLTLLASFPGEFDTAKLLMDCALLNDRSGTDRLPNILYHTMVKTFTDRKRFDTCEVVVLRVGCYCKQVGGVQKLRNIYGK